MVRDDFLLKGAVLSSLQKRAKQFGSRSKLSAETGIPSATLEKILMGKADPSVSRIAAICSALGITIDSMFTGMSDESGDWETNLPKPEDDPNQVSIPIMESPASAGGGALPFEDLPLERFMSFRQDWLRRHFGDPNNLVILPVRGESMLPDLADGDIVMINQSETSGPDGLFVLRLGDDIYVKRLQRTGGSSYRLISSNPAYAPVDIDLAQEKDGFKIIGRVVWLGRRL